MAPHPIPIADRKRALRAIVRASPGAVAPEALPALFDRVEAELGGASPVGAFVPFADEPDLLPLLARLQRGGTMVTLPRVVAPDAPLLFARWDPAVPLVRGSLNTWAPPPDAAPCIPACLLVPGLAFDRAGRRLGRGGGFYDRTLAMLDGARAIGVVAAARLLDEIPAEPFDRTVDVVVTERGRSECRPPDQSAAGR